MIESAQGKADPSSAEPKLSFNFKLNVLTGTSVNVTARFHVSSSVRVSSAPPTPIASKGTQADALESGSHKQPMDEVGSLPAPASPPPQRRGHTLARSCAPGAAPSMS